MREISLFKKCSGPAGFVFSLISAGINNPTLILQGVVHPCLVGRALLGAHPNPGIGLQVCLLHQVSRVQPWGSLPGFYALFRLKQVAGNV